MRFGADLAIGVFVFLAQFAIAEQDPEYAAPCRAPQFRPALGVQTAYETASVRLVVMDDRLFEEAIARARSARVGHARLLREEERRGVIFEEHEKAGDEAMSFFALHLRKAQFAERFFQLFYAHERLCLCADLVVEQGGIGAQKEGGAFLEIEIGATDEFHAVIIFQRKPLEYEIGKADRGFEAPAFAVHRRRDRGVPLDVIFQRTRVFSAEVLMPYGDPAHEDEFADRP